MKKLPLLFSIVLSSSFFSNTFAQKASQMQVSNDLKKMTSTSKIKPAVLGDAVAGVPAKQNASTPSTLSINETKIGSTFYDLQSNSSICNRLVNHGNGKFSATWTKGENASGFPNRGTGYNFFDGTSWGALPTGRIEQNGTNSRTGWSNIAVTSTGKEINVSHGTTISRLIQNSRPVYGTGTWSQATLNSVNPMQLWPRMVVGGANGQTVHMIGLTEPAGGDFTGTLYNGMNGALLYSRSTDGGATYSAPIQLPGCDSSLYESIGGDNYAIDARGDVVVVAVVDFGNPVRLWKSVDNGVNWEMLIAMDNGIVKYDDTLTILDTNDFRFGTGGSVAVIIDNNDIAHVAFDGFEFTHSAPGSSFTWRPLAINGLGYWNENMQEGKYEIIADVVYDWDGDGVRPGQILSDALATSEDLARFHYGNMAISSCMPTFSIDTNNNIYLLYSSITEDIDFNNNGYYRHTYAMRTQDAGCTWSLPIDATPGSSGMLPSNISPNPINPDNHEGEEIVFASAARLADENVYFTYEVDFLSGTNRNTAGEVIPGDNDIIFKKLPVSIFDSIPSFDCNVFVKVEDPGGCAPAVLTASCASSFNWSNGDTTQAISVNATGDYTLIANTGCIDDNNVPIPDTIVVSVIKNNFIVATINGITTVCNDSTMLSTPFQANYTYNWSTGDSGTSTYGHIGDTITLTVTDTLCNFTDTKQVIVTAADTIVNATITPSSLHSCEGQALTLTADGGVSYVWSNGLTTPMISLSAPANSGNYYVIATGLCGNKDTSAIVSVTVYPTPAAPVITYDATTLTVNSNQTGGTHKWLKNGVIDGANTGDSINFANWQLLVGKKICAIYVDANGCLSDTSNCLTPIATGIENISSNSAISIYPNPSNGDVFVKINNESNVKLVVRNILGQDVINKNLISNITKFDMNAYGEGIYFFNVISEKTQQTVKVIVK